MDPEEAMKMNTFSHESLLEINQWPNDGNTVIGHPHNPTQAFLSQQSQLEDQERKKTVRFSAGEDILALHEVLQDNPFEMTSRWKVIAERMKEKSPKAFTARNVKDRVDHILKLFIKGEREILKKSGTEEEYTDREHLLEQVKSLKESSLLIPKSKRAKTEARREEGKSVRMAAAAALSTHHMESADAEQTFEIIYEEPTPTEECFVEIPVQHKTSPSPEFTTLPQQPDAGNSEEPASTKNTASRVDVNGPQTSSSPLIQSPATFSTALPNHCSAAKSKTLTKALFNKSVVDHMTKKNESEVNLQLQHISLEILKAENEKKRLQLEENKLKMLMDNQNKIFQVGVENEKKTRELEKKLEIIIDNQKTILALLLPIPK